MFNDEFGANIEQLETTLKSAQDEFQEESNQPKVTMAVEEFSSGPPPNAR